MSTGVGPLILVPERLEMVKTKQKQNKEREDRITMEIIVDAYSPEEQAMGWYYYLEDTLQFPFTAVCNGKRAISPLLVEDEVDVIGMAPEEECEKEMFVTIRWERDGSVTRQHRLSRRLKIGTIG